jgi:hypothetical protein
MLETCVEISFYQALLRMLKPYYTMLWAVCMLPDLQAGRLGSR